MEKQGLNEKLEPLKILFLELEFYNENWKKTEYSLQHRFSGLPDDIKKECRLDYQNNIKRIYSQASGLLTFEKPNN